MRDVSEIPSAELRFSTITFYARHLLGVLLLRPAVRAKTSLS